MQYRREIDGLRAIAVLPVILFHAGFSWFSGGYVGVDVFFVISGYLITSILIGELDAGTFSIAKFYERRARRILPALFFVVACCIPFAWMWMLPSQFKDFSQAVLAISFFASNVLFWLKSGYFAPAAEENPLLHTWSLAVEEQFYIFFPVLLILLWRFGKNPSFYFIVALSAASLALSEYGWRKFPTANFYLLPTRIWELGAGAICAFLLHKKEAANNNLLSITGLALIGYSVFAFDESIPFPSLYALAPVGGTALIIMFGSQGTVTARLLSNKALVGVGLISFSAYLWHQPLLAFARIRSMSPPSSEVMASLAALSMVLAYLTWKFIEQPFRKTNGKSLIKDRKSVFAAASAATLALFSTGLLGHLGTETGRNGSTLISVDEMIAVNHGLSRVCEKEFTLSPECRTGENPEIMLWGDSYAMHLVDAIVASESFAGKNLIQFTKSVCSPLYGIAFTSKKYTEEWAEGCISFNESVKSWLAESSSVRYVIMSSPLDLIRGEVYYDGEVIAGSPGLVAKKMNETAAYIRSLGKLPVFVSPPPRTGGDLSKCAAWSISLGMTMDCSFLTTQLSPRHKVAMELLRLPDLAIPVIELEDYLCSDLACETQEGDIPIFRDDGHLSRPGSALLGRKYDLLAIMIEAAESSEAPLAAGKSEFSYQ